MGVITVYVGDTKHTLEEIPRLLVRGNQALQTLERYKVRLDDAATSLTALEVEDLVTVRDVAAMLQRSETVRRVAEQIQTSIVELGAEAHLIRLQMDELLEDVDDDRELVLLDYLPDDKDERLESGAGRARRALHRRPDRPARRRRDPASPATDASRAHRPRPEPPTPRATGCSTRCPASPRTSCDRLVERFGSLQKLMRVTTAGPGLRRGRRPGTGPGRQGRPGPPGREHAARPVPLSFVAILRCASAGPLASPAILGVAASPAEPDARARAIGDAAVVDGGASMARSWRSSARRPSATGAARGERHQAATARRPRVGQHGVLVAHVLAAERGPVAPWAWARRRSATSSSWPGRTSRPTAVAANTPVEVAGIEQPAPELGRHGGDQQGQRRRQGLGVRPQVAARRVRRAAHERQRLLQLVDGARRRAAVRARVEVRGGRGRRRARPRGGAAAARRTSGPPSRRHPVVTPAGPAPGEPRTPRSRTRRSTRRAPTVRPGRRSASRYCGCCASHITSSSALARSNSACRPSASTTSTGPSTRTISVQGCRASSAGSSSARGAVRRRLLDRPAVRSTRRPATASATGRVETVRTHRPAGHARPDRRRPVATVESGVRQLHADDHDPAASGRQRAELGQLLVGHGRRQDDDHRFPRLVARHRSEPEGRRVPPASAMADVSASASATAAATSGRWRTSWRPEGSGMRSSPTTSTCSCPPAA